MGNLVRSEVGIRERPPPTPTSTIEQAETREKGKESVIDLKKKKEAFCFVVLPRRQPAPPARFCAGSNSKSTRAESLHEGVPREYKEQRARTREKCDEDQKKIFKATRPEIGRESPERNCKEQKLRRLKSPTLRRAWPRDGPEAAICVQGIDVQCVLQFTLIHAAGCALHRRTSRVIHRSKL